MPSQPRVHREHLASPPGRTHQPDRNRFFHQRRWRNLSIRYRRMNPLCVDPYGTHKAEGRIVPAQHVDHIVSRARAPHLAFDWENLQGLCIPCHNRKTREEPR